MPSSALATTSGNTSIDILWSSYANYPGSLTSITNGNFPTLSGDQKNENLDVSALWSPPTFSQGDQLQIVSNSVSGVTQLTLTLNLTATN